MRLEKIVLNGFKSFADKTELAFDCSITAIVGPNGCGKSNVVDAVKWVLGEQSVKSLRSGQMADVIFSGSSSKKAAGSAEVSLIISNTEGASSGRLPIETDQVQITRRIYRSGESDYLINNKICRLKDIRELFMDTGIGVRAYSIIEQGQIGQLLGASKTDRRIIFEEAAGISKYKAHKKEALRKLDQTEQNLLRLADILGEVQKQLRSIKYQAGKARNYLQYRQRLKELQVNYSLAEYHKISSRTKEKAGELGRLEEDFAKIAAEISSDNTLLARLNEEKTALDGKLNETGNSLISVQSKIEQQLQKIEFLRTRITELQQRQSSAAERIEKLQEQQKQFNSDLTKYRDELTEGEKKLIDRQANIEELEKTIEGINIECSTLEAQLEDEKSGIIDIVRRTAQLHNEVQSISVYRDNLSSQKDRLSNRAAQAHSELEQLLTEKAQNQARADDIEKVLEQLTSNLQSKLNKSQELEALIASDNNRLAHSKEALSALSSEMSILTDMETRREGLNNAVKEILTAGRDKRIGYVEGVLADIITADVKYASAVEAALEGKTDAVVVNNSSKLLADNEMLGKLEARVKFVCIDKAPPFADNRDLSQLSAIKGRVVEFVKYDSGYASLVWNLLGKTLVVESIDSAVDLSRQFADKYNFVTLKGEFLSADGVVKTGPLGKAAGLISRKSRLNQLHETITNIRTEVANLESQITRNQQSREHTAKLCTELRTAIYEANTEKMQINSKLDVCEQNIKKLHEEQPLIAGEIDLLAEQIAQSVQKEYDSKQKLEELETVNEQRAAHIKELETKYAEQKTLQQSQVSRLTDLKVELGQVTEHQQAIKQTIKSLQSQVQTNQTAIEAAQQETKTSSEQRQQAQSDILESEAAISQLYLDKEEKQKSSRTLQDEIDQLLEKQNQLSQTVREKYSQQHEVEQKINELKIELGQLEVKEQDLIESVREQLELDLVESYKNFSDENVDWEQIRSEITDLRGKIERLGNVNVDAIAEQEELEKRNEFLSTQVEDLNSSKEQLQQLINRLNKTSREKFAEAFEEIRVNFQQIFRKLFGGGRADILLEDTDDILEAGIEIVARPPGKETRTISLLSGGEKSMTAIALLFAVFKSKPSPFCFLDEVDAALDEANNERFNMLIHEFQKESQFIIITHAKRTMSIADQLYGITMQRRGVSKKIAVRFGEYEPEEETAAVA